MNSNMQLLSFFISFIFGVLFYFFTMINFKLIKNLKRWIQHVLTFIYVLDVIIIYIIIFYHLNKGYFHVYFILVVILGFIFGYFLYKKLIIKIDIKKVLKIKS